MLDLRGSLLFNSNRDHFETGPSSSFERQHWKAAIAGDHPEGHGLLYETPARRRDKLQQFANFRRCADLRLNLLQSLGGIELRPRKQAKRLVERFDALGREASPLKAGLIF